MLNLLRTHQNINQQLTETIQRIERAQAEVLERDDVIERLAARVAEMLDHRARERGRNVPAISDGTFMPESERLTAIEEYELWKYERHAAGGRARAQMARHVPDGKFLISNGELPS